MTEREAVYFLWKSRAFRVQLFVVVIATLFAIPFTFMAFDNMPPYVFDASRSQILPEEALGGDQMLVRWKVVYNRSCVGTNRRVLFDPRTGVVIAIYDTEPVASSIALEDGYLNKTFILPKVIQTGRVGYRATLSYHCNLLQQFWPLVITTPNLYFTIAPR